MSASGFSLNRNTDSVTMFGTISIGGNPDPFTLFDEKTFLTVTTSTLFSFISTNDNTRISGIALTSNTFGLYTVKIDAVTIYKRRSSPLSSNNADIVFYELQPLANGETITVEYLPDRLIGSVGTGEVSGTLLGFIQVT